MTISPVTTSPQSFLFHDLFEDQTKAALGTFLGANGTGFSYNDDGLVLSGEITQYTFGFLFDFGDGVQSIPFMVTEGASLSLDGFATIVSDPSLMASSLLLSQALIFANLWPEDRLGPFVSVETGSMELQFSVPLVHYQTAPNTLEGTMDGDAFYFGDAPARIKTLAGDDWVRFDGATGSVRIALNSGDDHFSVWRGDLDTVVYGGAGNDRLVGGDGTDILSGGKGHDVLRGGNLGADRLKGGAGRDLLFGSNEDNVLFGGWGADVLTGARGNDALTGGPGRDVFWIAIEENGTEDAPEIDVVHDFTHGEDTLVFGYTHNGSFTAQEAFDILVAHAEQDGDDTVFTYKNSLTVFRNTTLEDFTLDSFFPDDALPMKFFVDIGVF